MDLNSGEYKRKQTFDDIAFNTKFISLNDELLSEV